MASNMTSLQDANIFELKPLIKHLNCKISAVTAFDTKKQLLALVSDDNDIVFRYTNDLGAEVLKLVSWFRKSSRVIHDVCFDPSGCWLLVVCFDNTLHVVPALTVVDKIAQPANNVFSPTVITSYVIPFVGPHECPNSKTCPNRETNPFVCHLKEDKVDDNTPKETAEGFVVASIETEEIASEFDKEVTSDPVTVNVQSDVNPVTDDNLKPTSESFMSSPSCPFPLSVVWWQSFDTRNRAAIGYSDGSICFVGLSPNCPFIASTSIEGGSVMKMVLCRDNNYENAYLLITSSTKKQFKLTLERTSINYTYPGEISPNSSHSGEDWQIVMPVKANSNCSDPASDSSQLEEEVFLQNDDKTMAPPSGVPPLKPQEMDDVKSRIGILPAARARLASLKSLGSKKFNAIKTRLSDNRQKLEEYMSENSLNSFAFIDSPSSTPKILSTFYAIQNLRNTYLLSALHNSSNTLFVHNIDISLPVFSYKIPKNCYEILISSNLLYTIQDAEMQPENGDDDDEKAVTETSRHLVNSVGVISSAMASVKQNDEAEGKTEYNKKSLLSLFTFENETVLSIYQMATYAQQTENNGNAPKMDTNLAYDRREISSPQDYVNFFADSETDGPFSLREAELMRNEFPKIAYDPCYVVTNRNIYYVQLSKEPFELFLDAALAGQWTQCAEFCTTFELSYPQCIEFAGDYLLRRKKVTQALFTYNMARIPPIRTALKLAIYGENYALMHLCAMALKCNYLLRSQYYCNRVIKHLLSDITYRHSEDVRSILPKRPSKSDNVNEGLKCSDFDYATEESISGLQMSASSQFHLSNLLLITLAEKAVKDKNYLPLWNFLATNTKFHTNMTSIVLSQSGLFSAALILAMARGACIDAYIGLTSVAGQEFGWYSELNVCLYNVSEPIFTECIAYLQQITTDYLALIQEKLEKIFECVLKRLEQQLNPFSAHLRPIVSLSSSARAEEISNDNKVQLYAFCKNLIETYLGVIIQLESQRVKQDNIVNALTTFQLTYEDNQFAIETANFPPLAAGCSHCACVIDGVAYFWGSNGVPCIYSVSKTNDPPEPSHIVKSLDIISQLNLEVHAVKCGRQHTLVLTNNGLYAFGNNNMYQLGIGKKLQAALQPMLVTALDGKNITILEAGQYHNAVVADGLLYSWGWGIYGQLGNGGMENVSEPEVVDFFKYKRIVQVSLGHAHSLVLCKERHGATELYVFGSNHFGQLGVGGGDDKEKTGIVKSLVPLKLDVSKANIRLIHTKFFSNLLVDENNALYCWGSSPQAIRLANQIKRRANAKQKIEENMRREMTRRLEATMSQDADCETVTIEVPILNEAQSKSDSALHDNVPLGSATPSGETKEIELKIIDPNKYRDSIASGVTEPPIPPREKSVQEPVELPQSLSQPPLQRQPQSERQPLSEKKQNSTESEPTDHMVPQLIDTSEVAGQILQVSSGLFHFALISSTALLYTWGKNLEHQLGTEDKERKAVNKPAALESIENPLSVECGADFTLVMTTDFIVKAFGGNTNGQCGRDLSMPLDKNKPGRLFCMPTTKRLMRLEGHCIDIPNEINLPRPRIRLDNEPTRYLKSVPKYQPHFVQSPGLSLELESPRSPGNTENIFGQETDDLASSIENLSLNDAESASANASSQGGCPNGGSSNDASPLDEQSYSRLHAAEEGSAGEGETTIEGTSELRNYIHYCLYIFHGLYDPDKIRKFANNQTDFHIRMLMLNFKFVEAFRLCLTECHTAQMALKIFEFFTKDTSSVPMRRQDLKFFIYHLFKHFIAEKFDLTECERFYLADLEYYLLELSYVLFFNNNNTELEQSLNQKFKSILQQDDTDQSEDYKLEDTDAIFDCLSVKFKTIVCQRLLQYSDAEK